MTRAVIDPGCRTPPHLVRDDGSREPCPSCDRQPLALAVVVRRSWWRRLLAWRPWAPAALAPHRALRRPMRAELVAIDEFGVPLWHIPLDESINDGRPAVTSMPSGGVPAPR